MSIALFIGKNRISVSDGGVPEGTLISRELEPHEYTFTPEGVVPPIQVVSNPYNQIGELVGHYVEGRDLGSFHLVDSEYGDTHWQRNGSISTDYPEMIGIFSHIPNWGFPTPIAMPTIISQINGLKITAWDATPRDASLRGARPEGFANVQSIEPFTTACGFKTYKISGTVNLTWTHPVIDEVVEFSIYISAIPNKENTTAYAIPVGNDGPKSGVHFRHISGDSNVLMDNIAFETNAPTINEFFGGLRRRIIFNTPLNPGDTANVSFDVKTKFSDFHTWSWMDGSVEITHRVDNSNLRQGRTVHNIGDALVSYDQSCCSALNTHEGSTDITLSNDGLTIDSHIDRGPWFYDGYAEMAQTIEQSVDVVGIEIISRTAGTANSGLGVEDIISKIPMATETNPGFVFYKQDGNEAHIWNKRNSSR